MSLEGQRIQPDRYKVIPRTLCFLLREDQILLLRLAPSRGPWGGMYNGVGGHIERGEDPTSAAKREIFEETGYSPKHLRLSGTIIVDTGIDLGIAIYVFVGEVQENSLPHSNEEGTLQWVHSSELHDLDLVEDLYQIIPKSLEAYASANLFSAYYSYDQEGSLNIQFHE